MLLWIRMIMLLFIQCIKEIVIARTNIPIRVIWIFVIAIPSGHILDSTPIPRLLIISIIEKSYNMPGSHKVNFISPRNVFSITANLYFLQTVITWIYLIMPCIARNVGIDVVDIVWFILSCKVSIFIEYRSRPWISTSLVQEGFLLKSGHIHTDAGPNLAKISIQIIKFIYLVTTSGF